MVTIYCCMCRGSLQVVEDKTALIRANFNGSLWPLVVMRKQEEQAKQGPPTAVHP